MVIVASEDWTTIQCLARDVEKDRLSVSGQDGEDANAPTAVHIVDTIGDAIYEVDVPVASTDTCLKMERGLKVCFGRYCPNSEMKRFYPVRSPMPGRCPSLDCGLLHDGGSTSCRQCVSQQAKLTQTAGIQKEHQGITVIKRDKLSSKLNIYPQHICPLFPVSDLEGRFLKSQTLFVSVHHPPLVGTKALFSFDREYPVAALDFHLVGRKTEIDLRALKIKKDFKGIEV